MIGVAAYDNGAVDNVKAMIADMPKNINVGQQNKHIAGTHEYEQYVEKLKNAGEYGPSRLNGGLEFAQRLVDEYAGTGEPDIKSGRWINIEIIVAYEIVGIVVNNLTGTEMATNRFKIHYSKRGIHIVPDYL
jgi:uncharacterized short protein YbdD (DUF466 family)